MSENMNGYNKITIYGNQTVDYLWIRDEIASEINIDTVNNNRFSPSWISSWDELEYSENPCKPPIYDSKTLLLADYSNKNLYGGFVTTHYENYPTGWLVYRIEPNSNKLNFVAEIPITQTNIKDYMAGDNIEYKYLIFINVNNTNLISFITPQVKTNFPYWSLMGMKSTDNERIFNIDLDNIWELSLNFQSGEQTQNIDKHIYDGLSKYPKVAQGDNNYMSGTITCLLSDINNEAYQIYDNIELQRKFKDFILDNNLKLLKDKTGNIYIVNIISNSFKYIDEVAYQPAYITFEWVEIMDSKGIALIDEIKEEIRNE